MKLNKRIIFPVAGLVSVCLLSVYYATYFILYVFGITTAEENSALFNLLIPLPVFATLISIRYILVKISNANQFRRNLDPLIILLLVNLLTAWAVHLKLASSDQLIIPVFILGLIVFVLLLWFVYTLSDTEDSEIIALPYLKYFMIVFLLFILIYILPDVLTIITKREFTSFDNVFYFIDGLKYIILIPFFLKNIKFIKSEMTHTSA